MSTLYTRKLALLCFFSMTTLLLSAQQLWTEQPSSAQSAYVSRNSQSLPERVKFYQLNVAALQSLISSAKSFNGTSGGTTTELNLPLADGSFMETDVYTASILSPELQALIPQVKTYQLVDRQTKNSLGRITITPQGISGIMFTGSGTAYIHPVNDDQHTHITYFAKEAPLPGSITCGVKDAAGTEEQKVFNLARIEAGDGELRNYRIAVSATGEYYQWAGSSVANALAYIAITMNQVTAIFERDVTITFTLVGNSNIIYTDPTTDPYSSSLSTTDLNNNITFTNTNLGVPYDLGIVFNNGWSGGLAYLSSACTALRGGAAAGLTFGFGANPTAGPQGAGFDGTVAHEIAHQFSATHTMSTNNGICTGNTTPASAWEPGGGSTIMAYANCSSPAPNNTAYQATSDLYFHVGSVQQMATYATTGNGNLCPVLTILPNSAPLVTVAAPAYTIPVSTPFFLTCNASDVDGNTLTYTWEQMEANVISATPPSATATTGPNFRSFPPSTSATRYLPRIATVVAGLSTAFEVLPSVARTMNFRVNVRDNAAGGGWNTQQNIQVNTSTASTPFTVTSQSTPVTLAADGTSTFTVTWDPGSTTSAPFNTANVSILFSADGGNNFSHVLSASTANDGSESVVIPNMITGSGRVMVRSIGNIFYNINAANITITSVCAAEGAELNNATTVSAPAGSATLNLTSTPNFAGNVFPTTGAALTSTDPNSTLAVFDVPSATCRNFNGNLFKYDTYTFQVSISGSYTFSRTPTGTIFNIYAGPFNPIAPCENFVASNGSYNGGLSATNTITVTLHRGVTYTAALGTVSNTSPALPYTYTLSVTASPMGSVIYNGYLNPGGSYSYRYVIVNNATGNIVAITTSPDLSNSTNYPTGTYIVYGFSYLTANFSTPTLNSYVGGAFTALTNALNAFTTSCGNISKNAITVNVLTALPVDLLPLTAVKDGAKVKLYWSTLTETNSLQFEIERSADGRNFSNWKTVPAAGNSADRLNYTVDDDNPFSTTYYRVKAISIDGKNSFTNIAMVKTLGKNFDVKMYPNPVLNSSTLELVTEQPARAVMSIYGQDGKTVYQETITMERGLNIRPLNMTKMAAGVYTIKIASAENIVILKAIKL